MRRHAARAGVHGKRRWCHIWRHTFARMYVVRGGDLETLRRLLGHESLETVRIYLEFRTQDLENLHFKLSPMRQVMEAADANG
jgi:integrase/recombinase XerD